MTERKPTKPKLTIQQCYDAALDEENVAALHLITDTINTMAQAARHPGEEVADVKKRIIRLLDEGTLQFRLDNRFWLWNPVLLEYIQI